MRSLVLKRRRSRNISATKTKNSDSKSRSGTKYASPRWSFLVRLPWSAPRSYCRLETRSCFRSRASWRAGKLYFSASRANIPEATFRFSRRYL